MFIDYFQAKTARFSYLAFHMFLDFYVADAQDFIARLDFLSIGNVLIIPNKGEEKLQTLNSF